MKRAIQYLPNAISITRLGCTPILIWLAYNSIDAAFAWLLLFATATDAIDGWIARRFHWTSQTGALLDSIADACLMVTVFFAIWHMHSYVFTEHSGLLITFTIIWTVVHVLGLVRYRKLASFHTRLTQIAIILFGLFTIVLFFYGFEPMLYYLAGFIGILAGIENFVLILLIPNWQPNIRTGLYGLIRNTPRDSYRD